MSEFALVEQARRSVAADPKKALALTEEHQRRFAGGPLSEESDFIAIEAERRLGHNDEARALADRFKKHYPTSMHGQSVTVPPLPKP
jgi:outer membrane protein assembly factor BamD (BamD/ComL family)